MIITESVCISLFGKTPGKWIGNITVKTCEGFNITFCQAMKRTLLVWITGMLLNIPFLAFVPLFVSKKYLMKKGNTYWDEACKTDVVCEVLPIWRYSIVIIVGIAFNVIIYIALIDYFLGIVGML